MSVATDGTADPVRVGSLAATCRAGRGFAQPRLVG
jgi:hypothetical protein